jgi:argininosuccinate synthase
MKQKTQRAIASRARRFFRALDEGKDSYKRADRLLSEILSLGMKPGDRVPLNSAGDKIRLDDLFANQNKVFRAHGIGRYELNVEKASQ